MKLAVVIGHNAHAQGANAVAPISQSEFEFNTEVAECMEEHASAFGIKVKTFKRKRSASYRQEIRDVYRKTDNWDADATIELHFNAFNRRVFGTETLSGPSNASLALAHAVQDSVTRLFERNASGDRGVKTYRYVTNGKLSLISGKAPAILVEPFFGDQKQDALTAHKLGCSKLAYAYLEGVADAWGLAAAPALVAENSFVEFAHMR